MKKIGPAEFDKIKDKFLTIHKEMKDSATDFRELAEVYRGTPEGKAFLKLAKEIMDSLDRWEHWFIEEIIGRFRP